MSSIESLKSGSSLGTDPILQQLLAREDIREQIQKMVDEMKAQAGFLSTVFKLGAHRNSAEEIQFNVEAFAKFCKDNRVFYDLSEQKLAQVKTLVDHMRQNKFLLAAVAGTLAGLGGADAGKVEILNETPGLFFAALPLLAVPFISMNVFKSFSERNLLEEAGTFARFAALMAAAVGIGFAATGLMSDQLGTLDMSRLYEEAASKAPELRSALEIAQAAVDKFSNFNIDEGLAETTTLLKSYSLGDYLLHALGGSVALTFAYKAARDKGQNAKNFLTRSFSWAGVKVGDGVNTISPYFDKAFMGFINVMGPPAIFALLSMTMAEGGTDDLKQYAGYYMTVLAAMGGAGVALLGSVLAYGKGLNGLGEVLSVKSKAFALSSSSATMSFTKEALRRMGISEGVRNSVVPLGATFNMGGTALYLGLTALCASMMLGHDPSAWESVMIMTAAIGTAFAAPGIPASSIAFMAPVLNSVGLNPQEQAAVFAMILVVDRVFDMMQTSLNVAGDMVVAMDVEAGKEGKGVGAPAYKAVESAVRKIIAAQKSGDGPEPHA